MVMDNSLWPSRACFAYGTVQAFLFYPCVVNASVGWGRGPMAVDEAIEFAKAISNGDSDSVLFVMHPVPHASTDSKIVIRNRRLAEDKIMSFLGYCAEM